MLLALCLSCALPALVSAKTTAALKVAFSPDIAGASTTVTFSAAFTNSTGGVPAPVTKSVTHLPAGLEVELAGATTCSRAKLELEEPGAGACPASSLLGAGSALASVDLGLEPIEEHAPVTAVLASNKPGDISFYFDGEGTYPITEQVIAKATLTGNARTGQTFTIKVPPIPSTVGGPNASIINFVMSLGRQKVISLARHHRGKIAQGRGIILPKSCKGKLSFPTKLYFEGQGPVSVATSVPCPRR